MERGEQVVEYVSLDSFVFDPTGILDENVNLNGDSLLGRRKLSDEKGHVFLMDRGMIPEVCKTVSSEGADVGQVSLIQREMSV